MFQKSKIELAIDQPQVAEPKNLEECAPAAIVNCLTKEVDGYHDNLFHSLPEGDPNYVVSLLFAIAVRLERIATVMERPHD